METFWRLGVDSLSMVQGFFFDFVGEKGLRGIGYFFRIRSQVNEAGQVKAAQYGKLVGGIAFRPRPDGQVSLSFQSYLNPAENDRNMENKLDVNLFPAADSLGRRK